MAKKIKQPVSPPVITSPPPPPIIVAIAYLLDALGNVLTDNSGNRLIAE